MLHFAQALEVEEVRRSYSICSSPFENELRVAIKKAEEGLFSSHAHKHFRESQVLDVLAPTGNFILPLKSTNKKHYVAFAAGSGITPIISLLKDYSERRAPEQILFDIWKP